MKNILNSIIILCCVLFMSDAFAFRGFDSNDLNLGSFSKIKCGTNVSCAKAAGNRLDISVTSISNATSIQGDGTGTSFGFRMNIISVTADDSPVAAECGSVFLNTITLASITLPEAGSLHGCEFTFVNALASSTYDIHPAFNDQITILTVSKAHLIRSVSQGHSITLLAISADAWAPIAISSIDHWLGFTE